GQIVIKPRQSDAPLKNPIITLDIPAGISVMDVRSWSQATCAAPDDFTWSGATSGPATITIDVRGTGPDYYFSEGCNGSTCPGVGHADFQVDLLVHPDHPFLNGEVVTLTETLSGDNTTAPGSPTPVIATTQVSFSVEIPGEKRARIEPACDVGGQEGFTVHYENVGGVSLTNVVVEIPIPKLADGSGTQVDTTWVSTTSAVGTVECNDGSGWSSTCNGTALQTRVLVGNMAPLTSGSVTVLLDTAGAASGTLVRATTTLTSTELLPLPLQPGSPLVVGECPGTVVIDGWHDISNDGVRQANELGIDLWRVALTNQASSITTTVFLGPSGMSTVQLAPETWTVTVVAAPGANPGSAFTTIVPASITVVTGQTQNLDIGVGCQCDDGDACTTDYCSPLGQCLLNLPVQGCCGNLIVNANETCDDGNTDPLDGCNFCQCGQGTLYNATTGHCDPTCGDGLVLPSEECDDANSVSGDGCSADCLEELGYACDLPAQACPPAWFCSGSTPAWCTPDILWCNVFPTYYCTVATNLDCSTVPADASLCTDTTCISQVELCHLCDVMGPSDCTQSLVESCDGIDNDQNGVTDETDFGLGGNPDLIGDPCTPTTGGCGELACDGSGGWECTTLTSPGDSTCDGVDDDCDGLTDEDAAPLSVTCPPSPAAVECAGALTSVSLPTISAQSGCNPVTQSDNAPSGYPLGSTTVTTTLTDAALAVDTCAATVEIVDSVSPVMTCPPDVNVNADPMYCGAFVPLTPTATDVCSAVVVTDDAPLIYDEGATDVTFVAADASGLTDTCSTTVTVTAAPPTITCPPTLTVDAPAEQCYADVTVPATMQPSCGPTIPWNVTSQPCAVGSSDVTLSSPGALPCTTVVTVNDVTGPVINCAMLASVSQIPSTITVGVQDACFVDTISIEAVTCYDKLPGLDLAADCTIVAVSNTLTVTGLFSPASHVSFTVRATDVSGNETVQLCETTVSAMPQGIEICTDGIDNNNDGLVDCADPLCPIDPMCPSLDLDNDGLDYATEQALGTNPNDDDSDDDGLKDGEEDANHNGVQDATETDANVADTDADGLSDGIETTSCYDVDKPNVACAETDPLVLDSDADGLSDGDEDANSNGVVDGSETNPTAADSDFDGANDKAEIDCGTDPNDASDTPVDAAAGLCSPIINTPDPGPAADAGSSADAGGTADTGGTTQTADPGPASSDSASSGCTQSSRRSVPLPMVILMVMLFTAIRVTRRLY
ncbi:MAG: cysteine-rich repeat protein, partial [Myxococcota bacterium]